MTRPTCASVSRSLIALILMFCVWQSALAQAHQAPSGWVEDDASGSAQVETKQGRTMLKLGVEHSTTLDPVPQSLQAGSIFDNRMIPSLPKELEWYRIPKWLGGKWQRQQETTVHTMDFATGVESRPNHSFLSEQQASFGVQKDKVGDLWDCSLASTGVSNHGSYRSIALVQFHRPVAVNAKEIVFREIFTVVNVMSETNVIMSSQRIESLTKYRPVGNRMLEASMSMKVYGPDGSPSTLQENLSYDRQIQSFSAVANYKGRDLRNEFAEFLRSQSLSNLIPDGTSN
ncbi:MAG: hypothetical protein K2Z81_09785 [Cyanobacteria bacterium]|nr:hypothetical protein [Cyanobacteriota bacterium]